MKEFIENIRKTDPYIEIIFMNGGCYQFHLLLAKYYDCEPYMTSEKDHVVSMFKGRFYDITGEIIGEFNPMSKNDIERAKKWSFHKTMVLQIGECQVCEEPIVV